MKKIIALTFIFQFSIFNFFAQSLTGYDIMKKNDEVPQAKTASFTATMTLTDKKGQTRVREVIEKSKDFGTVKKSVIVFTTPKDVSGVGYLCSTTTKKLTEGKKTPTAGSICPP